MEDLRKDYNVQKRKRSLDLYNWWRSNKYLLRFLLIIITLSFFALKPDLIGYYIGNWFNNLYIPFKESISMTSNEWYLILISISTFVVLYKILNIDFNSKGKR